MSRGQLTEHVALVAVSGEGPELIFPHRVALVALPGELHHLQGRAETEPERGESRQCGLDPAASGI